MEKEFTKDDLKTGMRITTRSGNRYLVLRDFAHEYDSETDILLNIEQKEWNSLNSYSLFLCHNTYQSLDVIKVEILEHCYSMLHENGKYITVWERKEKSEKDKKIEELQKQLDDIKNKMEELKNE